MTDDRELRRGVRERYGTIAQEGSTCCGDDASTPEAVANELGYSQAELASAGEANLGLGCGNPVAIGALEPGETVLDLGAGGGFDCLLAAEEVGPEGHVIGVDMTPEMVETARENAADHEHVEFRLGEIEHLPVADTSVDVILSNCVLNLSPEKARVFDEAYRVLRPGGRLAISDVVLTAPLPADSTIDPETVSACLGGAAPIGSLESMLARAGFTAIEIEPESDSASFIREWDDERDLSDHLLAARITARRPV